MAQTTRTRMTGKNAPPFRPWRWLAVPAALAMMGSGQALADTDVLVNMDACSVATEGLPGDTCPNSLSGPAGGDVKFTSWVVWNTGDSPGTVTLQNDLPINAILKALPSGVTCTGGPGIGNVVTVADRRVSCTLAAFAGTGTGNAQRLEFLVTLPTVNTNWTNAVEVSSSVTDATLGNNTRSRGYTTIDAADLALAVVTTPTHDAGSPIDPGTAYTQTLTVTNNGPTAIPAAGRMTVGFTVPVGAAITSAGGTNGWTCSPATNIAPGTNVTCTRAGGFASSATSDLVIQGMPNVSGSITTNFSVQGWQTASVPMPDGQPDNNLGQGIVYTSSATTASMGITKTRVGASSRALGDPVSFTVTPRFLGGVLPVGAVVRVTDTVGAGLSFVSASGTDWVCGSNVCDYTVPAPAPVNAANLPPITVQATVDQNGTLTNEATVSILSGASLLAGSHTDSATVTGTDSANLRMTKTASNNGVAVNLNAPYTYSLTVRNMGPLAVPAAGGNNPPIRITENIPAGVTISGASGTGWDCSSVAFPFVGPGSFTCNRAAALGINADAPALVLNAVRTTEGTATNNACTTFGTVAGTPTRVDYDSTNNCRGVGVGASDAATGVQADLSITKSAGSTAIYAGENLTYTLMVRNNSATHAANDVVLTDVLNNLASGSTHGPGLVSVGGLTGGQSCTPTVPANPDSNGSITLTCQLGTLAADSSQSITVTVKPTTAQTSMRSNTATVWSATTFDENHANNEATVAQDTQVSARVDLAASKVVATSAGGGAGDDKLAAAGSRMDYIVRVTNNGPSSAENVWLRDPLPADAILVSGPTPTVGGSCSVVSAATSAGTPTGAGTPHPAGTPGGVLECVWGTDALPAFLPFADGTGGQREVSYSMRSLPGLPVSTELANTVTVGTKTDEPNLANNTASARVTLTRAELDVQIQMTHDVDGIPLGDKVRYAIRVSNGGPSYATQVVMRNQFPVDNAVGVPSDASFAYVGGSLTADPDVSCTEPGNGDGSGELVCTIPVLAPGEDRVIYFEMEAAGLPPGAMSGAIHHLATVAPSEEEWLSNGNDTAANNTTRDTTSTNRAAENADLVVDKLADPAAPARVVRGGTITYTITVTNNGPATSNGAQLIDALPAGLEFVSASGGACTEASGTVTCAVGTLANGNSKVFTIVTRVPSDYTGSGVISNTAVVDAPGDPDTSNNTDDAETPPLPPPVTSIPVDNPLALLALIFGVGLVARWQHGRRRH